MRRIIISGGVLSLAAGALLWITGPRVNSYEQCRRALFNTMYESHCFTWQGEVFLAPQRLSPSRISSVSSPEEGMESEADQENTTQELGQESPLENKEVEGSTELPSSVRIEIPFMVQAPTGHWSHPYDEACEEASLLMVEAGLNGEKEVSPTETARRISEFVQWQTENGYKVDISLLQLRDIAEIRGWKTRILEPPTADDLRQELARGNPIIVPSAGRLLGNPYFSGEGPQYHMLVIVGYDEDGFWTHDPGTRRGESHYYQERVLMNAIHDYEGDLDAITDGPRRGMVIQ